MEKLNGSQWNPQMTSFGRGTAQAYTQVLCYPSLQITSNGIWFGDTPLHFNLPVLLMQISAFIVASRVVQILLRPLRQPTVVSDLLGGVLLGPSFLGQFPNVQAALFPDHGVFVGRTLATFGIIYQLFSIGVKMNFRLLSKERNVVIISLSTLFLPYATVVVLYALLHEYVVNDFAGGRFIVRLAAGLSVSPFGVIFPYLYEFRFLNTELGRLSLTIGALHDVFGFLVVLLATVGKGGEIDFEAIFYRLGTLAFVIILSFLIIRPMLVWVIQRTPEGKEVQQGYVVAILLGVLIIALWSQIFGFSIIQGSFIFGLAIPDGPPLGSTITEKIDTIERMFFQPLFYVGIGQRVNVFAHTSWSADGSLILILLGSRLAKLVAALASAMACRMPFRDGLSLGLLLNVYGLMNFMYFSKWEESGLVSPQTYAVLVIVSLLATMAATPMFTWLMKKSKPYMPYSRRTIQHSKLEIELSLVTCIHNEENIAPILNLVEVTNATREHPVAIHVMHLVELVGRATPMLIAHKPQNKAAALSSCSSADVFSAFRSYARHRDGCVTLQLFTSISPCKTMHEDVCSIALQKRASVIIIPFHKRRLVPAASYEVNNALQIINPNVLAQAPCSVGILVERGGHRTRFSLSSLGTSLYRIGVIFLGGPDDREALSYAARMVEHPCAVLKVMRFVSIDQSGQNSKEKQLDDDLVSDFQTSWLGNRKVVYQEEHVQDAEETMNLFLTITDVYDLMVVGQRQVDNSGLVQGLSSWIESPELGVIGDMCSSSDFFGGVASVLVMQQQAKTTATSQESKICNISTYTGQPHDQSRSIFNLNP